MMADPKLFPRLTDIQTLALRSSLPSDGRTGRPIAYRRSTGRALFRAIQTSLSCLGRVAISAFTLSPLEVAAGTVFGALPAPGPAPPPVQMAPREALNAAVVSALEHPPCLVAFSGGRDSSAVLATACAVARARSLPSPIALSLRFDAVASTTEDHCQELVIRHLGLEEWERIQVTTELDFLGAHARHGLSRHGLLWPANAHFLTAVMARAGGGSVLTGLDGDGLLAGWRWQRAQAVLSRLVPPRPRDVRPVLLALATQRVRAAWLARGFAATTPRWLKPDARRELTRRLAREQAGQPRQWDQRIAWYARRRYLAAGVTSLGLLAADHGTTIFHPLCDPGFLAALAAEGGPAGYGDRFRAMRELFGELLPAEVLTRPSKAEFGRALWGPEARAFAADWDGRGLDASVVDGRTLREVWAEPNPPLAAATLIQAAWLAADACRFSPAV